MNSPKLTQQQAVALAYHHTSPAPTVLAKGRGVVAQAIIERAQQAGVFVHQSPELVSLLMQVDLDQHIPPVLYHAIAELLVFIYRLEQEAEQPKVVANDSHRSESYE